MSKQISALMFSSDEGLWERYCEILEPENYLLLLLPAEKIEESKQAISEQELIILDAPVDEEERIRAIRAIRKILGDDKCLFVVSNLIGEGIVKAMDAGADDYRCRLESKKVLVILINNLVKRYRLS